ncbi:WXG100 family type VII secretion target, partial [Amycolatopsis pithecellobii]
MAKTWPEVKALLDDPSVPPGDKTVLLSSWQREHPAPGWPLNLDLPKEIADQQAEVKHYADVYGTAPMLGYLSTDDAYAAAKKAGDQAAYNEHEEKKAVNEGKTKLEGKQPPASGGGGTKTSDELFDAAEPALKLFQTFGSLLAKIPDDCRGNTRALDFNNDIKKRFDEQRGISFANFLADADHFKTGSTTVDGAIKDTGSALDTLFRTWSGSGANAASDHYNDKILPKATKLGQTLEDANEATTTAVSTVFQLCKGKADAIVNMYTDQVGKADYNMAQKVVGVANGEHAGKDDLKAIAGWMDINFGTNLTDALNDDGCCDDDDIKEQGQNLAKQWIQNHFNPDMWDRLYKGFDKTCTDTKDLVNQAYDALDGVMGKIKNEFEGGIEPSSETKPSQTTTGG